MNNASAVVEDLNEASNFFDAVISTLAVSRRICVSISSKLFLSFFVTEPSPTMSTHEPLSTAHRRALVATSPNRGVNGMCHYRRVGARIWDSFRRKLLR